MSPKFWGRTEERLLAELSSGEALRTPVSLIYHSLDEVNEKLGLGRYFFMDIVREGILLFEEPGHPLAEPRPLTAGQALQESRDYFEEWFESAGKLQRWLEFSNFGDRRKKLHFSSTRPRSASTTACCWSGPSTAPSRTI